MLQPKKAKSRFTLKEKAKIAKSIIKTKLTPKSKESREMIKDWQKEQDNLRAEFPNAYKKGGATKDKKWIQKAINPAHKGYCTPMTKPTCTPKRKALAKTLKKMAKNR